MLKPILALLIPTITALCFLGAPRMTDPSGQEACAQERNVWVGNALQEMEAIKPGMTRGDLLKTFTTEGGISARTQRTFVSRECGYFKVEVEFKPVGPDRDDKGRFTLEGDPRDIIVKISRPFLQFSISD
jgi:hypothetical protein